MARGMGGVSSPRNSPPPPPKQGPDAGGGASNQKPQKGDIGDGVSGGNKPGFGRRCAEEAGVAAAGAAGGGLAELAISFMKPKESPPPSPEIQ